MKLYFDNKIPARLYLKGGKVMDGLIDGLLNNESDSLRFIPNFLLNVKNMTGSAGIEINKDQLISIDMLLK